MLEELQGGGLDCRELQERLGISKATSHRHIRLLSELGVIERVNGELQLTESGKLLPNALIKCKREANSALQLAPVVDAIRHAPVEIDIEAFAGATVTSAEQGDRHSPVARLGALVHETDTLPGIDIDSIAPLYMAEIQQPIVGGRQTEIIGLPDVTEDILMGYPDKCFEAGASGYLTVWLRDDLPFGLAIFDDRVGLGVQDADTRLLRVFVDTDSSEVYEWADAVYESYKTEAIRLEEFTYRGFRKAMEVRAQTG